MSTFINTEDYDASIHAEILTALTRSDAAIIEICEDRAIAEMRSYMSARYDTDSIFSATGDNRNPLILMMAIDISVYHIFCIHNPQKLSQIRKDRYDRAIDWLKQVASCKISIDGAPLLGTDAQKTNSPWQMTSNPKRTNHL